MRGFVYRFSRDCHLYIFPPFRFNFIIGKRIYIHTYIHIYPLFKHDWGGVKIITNELNYILKMRIILLTKYSYNKNSKNTQ